MIRRPPISTPLYSSAASDVYKRQVLDELDELGEPLRGDVAVAGLEAGGVEVREVLAHGPVGRRLGAGPGGDDLLVEPGQRARGTQHGGVGAREAVPLHEAVDSRRRQLRLRRAQLRRPRRVNL